MFALINFLYIQSLHTVLKIVMTFSIQDLSSDSYF